MKKNSVSVIAIVAVMWIGHLLVDFMIGVWAVYKTVAGLDIALAGMIAGASALIGESLQGFFGPLTDRGYRHRLILIGLGLTLASVLMAYTENYYFLFLLFLMTCIGSGAFHPAAVSVMNELSENRKALLMTLFQSGGALGLAFSQLVFSQAYFFFEGRTLILAVPAVLLMVFVFFKNFGSQAVVKEPPRARSSWKTFAQFFRTPELRSLYIAQLSCQSIFWGIIFILPDVLVERGYDEWISLGGAHLFLIIGGAVMMVPAGYLADKYSCRTVIIGTLLLGLFSFYTFLINPFLSPLTLCILLFILGAALGTVSPVILALGNRFTPSQSGIVSAFLMGLVWCVAEGIGQGGGGLLTKLFSEQAPTYALACLGTLFFVGLVASYKLPIVEKDLLLEIA